ncbi:MAG: BamA/TamA family outer membrane protein [Pseudomonadota bacterium]
MLVATTFALPGLAWPVSAIAAENYRVVFQGAPKDELAKLKLVSELAQEKRPYPTNIAIRLAGRRDQQTISDALSAAGYFANSVTFVLRVEEGAEKAEAIFEIDPQAKFEIANHRIVYNDTISAERPMSFDAVGLEVTPAADGTSLRTNHEQFLSSLWAQGFPGAQLISRRVEADFDALSADAVYEFESGPLAKFGPITFEGADRTKPNYMEALIPWEQGEIYDRGNVIAYRDTLSATGLFSTVDVETGTVDPDGSLPILVELDERKRRTFGVGASFSTVEGPGGRLFFEYRNLFGGGEKARVDLAASLIEQSLLFSINKPLPLLPGSIFADAGFVNQTTDAFDAQNIGASAGVAKEWFKGRLETRAGLAFDASRITVDDETENTFFFSLPLTAIWDTEDDPLSLTKGARATLSLTPFTGFDTFTRAEFNARSRYNFGNDDRFTLAGRIRLGGTFGTSLDDLPANRRYFSGGGSSVRGFEFQAVGPRDEDFDPIGGRSVIEGALEARSRVFGPVQIAAFADAGSVSAQSSPDFSGDFQIGVGGGVRYISPIGPLRVDFAVPVERREGDAAWQLYISLGQPF